MLLACRRDACVLALGQRVIFPHQTLQLGEFAHHLGEQISFGEPRRAFCFLGVSADHGRKLACETLDARDALSLRAEFLVKDNVLEFR